MCLSLKTIHALYFQLIMADELSRIVGDYSESTHASLIKLIVNVPMFYRENVFFIGLEA